jgi:hypothetical protein
MDFIFLSDYKLALLKCDINNTRYKNLCDRKVAQWCLPENYSLSTVIPSIYLRSYIPSTNEKVLIKVVDKIRVDWLHQTLQRQNSNDSWGQTAGTGQPPLRLPVRASLPSACRYGPASPPPAGQLPVQMIQGAKRLQHNAYHSLPSIIDDNNAYRCTTAPKYVFVSCSLRN